MTKAVLQLETLTCPTCVKKIESALNKTEGVESSEVSFNSGKAKIQFDESKISIDQVKRVVKNLGYVVLSAQIKA